MQFTRDELESWLYQMALNNVNTEFEFYIIEIIHRLNGFEVFVMEKRKDDSHYCGGY